MSGPHKFIIVPLLLMMVRDIGVLSIPPQEHHNSQPVSTTPLSSEQLDAVHENQTRVMNSSSFVVAGMTQPQSNFKGTSLQNTLQHTLQDVPELVAQIDPKLISSKDNQESPQGKTEPLATVDPQELTQVMSENWKEKPLPSPAFCLNQNSSVPEKLICSELTRRYNISFNSLEPCTFNCTYNPEEFPVNIKSTKLV